MDTSSTSVISADDGSRSLTYDAAGNVIKKKSGNMDALEYQYNTFNKLMKSIAGSNTTSLSYDGSGNMQSLGLSIGSGEAQSRKSHYHYSNGVLDVSDRKRV